MRKKVNPSTGVSPWERRLEPLLRRLLAKWCLVLLSALPLLSPAQTALTLPEEPLTQVQQLLERLRSPETWQTSAHLTGTVYALNPLRQQLVLGDATGLILLNTGPIPDSIKPGIQAEVLGPLILGNGSASLRPSALLESHAEHNPFEHTGHLYLSVGKHPFRLQYVQETRRSFLNLFYSGPGFEHEKIPPSALWHQDPETPSNFLAGVQYAYYEGIWDHYADRHSDIPESTGVSTNLVNRIVTRGLRYSLEFEGFLDITQAGAYSFSLRADDRARLFFPGTQAPRLLALGPAPGPQPEPLQAVPCSNTLPDYVWARIQGEVLSVGAHNKKAQLGLLTDHGPLQVTLADTNFLSQTNLLHQQLQATGLASASRLPGGERVFDSLYVLSPEHLKLLPAAGSLPLPQLDSVEAVRRLSREAARAHYPVHLQGTVSCLLPRSQTFLLQGLWDGVVVQLPEDTAPLFELGSLYEVEGYTEAGRLFPYIVCKKHSFLGRGHLPTPQHAIWTDLASYRLDSEWVEVQGVVLNVHNNLLTLGMPGGELDIVPAASDSQVFSALLNATVRARGTLVTEYNHQNEIQRQVLRVNSPLDLALLGPEENTNSEPSVQDIASLHGFNPQVDEARLVTIRGQVLAIQGFTHYLTDGTNGLRFITRERTSLRSGDLVQVKGVPSRAGQALVLRYASVHALGHAPLPNPQRYQNPDGKSVFNDATWVWLEGRLFNFSTNVYDQVLELRAGPRSLLARLNFQNGLLHTIPQGSLVRVTGICRWNDSSSLPLGTPATAEILLTSAANVQIRAKPSWWTLEHSIMVVSAMCLGLLGALVWITSLRKRVDQRTRQLKEEIAGHHRTEEHLSQQTQRLLSEIEERKRMQGEIERIHQQLVEASRQAGQAEVAASVLHNVGNVLNSVNVSTGLLTEQVRSMRIANLAKAAVLLNEHQSDLGQFLANDPRGHQIPLYLKQVADLLQNEQESLLKELNGLSLNIEHIKEIIAMQQTHAKRFGVYEQTALSDLVEDALKLQAGSFQRHGLNVRRHFETVPLIQTDRHQVLQILVNLLQNAKRACQEAAQPQKEILLHIYSPAPEKVCIEVTDNGIGIAPENMTRIFAHGFTTRKDGHGFGLHSAALAAKEMQGSLTAHSAGLGRGASFVLELPLHPAGSGPNGSLAAAPAGVMPADAPATPDATLRASATDAPH